MFQPFGCPCVVSFCNSPYRLARLILHLRRTRLLQPGTGSKSHGSEINRSSLQLFTMTTKVSGSCDAPSDINGTPSLTNELKAFYEKYGMNVIYAPVAAVVVSLVLSGNYDLLSRWIVYPAYSFTLTIAGTTIGVGLGLGLATHVYDFLTDLSKEDVEHSSFSDNAQSPRSTLGKGISIKQHPKKQGSASTWEDDTAYSSLMSSAGYDVSDHMLRAQIIKHNSKFCRKYYPFTDAPESEFKAVRIMNELMPHLPTPVSLQLGKFIEHIMRDYVSSWYSMVDANVSYENEANKRARLAIENTLKETEEQNNHTLKTSDDQPKEEPHPRIMLLSTTGHRPVPMMGSMYTSLVLIFGNLAQRVEGVNLLSLLLLKWTKVIGHTLKVYRQMRNKALAKNTNPAKAMLKSANRLRVSINRKSSSHITENEEDKVTPLGIISEMAVTREFLMHGKLHRAVTFGMDIPSLLFADSKGDECGLGSDDDENDIIVLNEDTVLEKRLFGTKMLYECELDYNRVLGNRLARALLPRAEYSSPLLRSMVTELIAGCVLCPIMSCFCPIYLNGWILKACAPNSDNENVATGIDGTESTAKLDKKLDEIVEDSVEMKLEETDMRTHLPTSRRNLEDEQETELTMSMATISSSASSPCIDPEDHETVMNQTPSFQLPSVKSSVENNDDGIHVGDDDDHSEDVDEGINTEVGTSQDRSVSMNVEEEDDEIIIPPPSGDFILPLLTMSLIELQGFLDFDDCRGGKIQINWDDPSCQNAISQLVLVLEAALIHGRRSVRFESSIAHACIEDLIEDHDGAIELTLPKYNPESLIKVLMDMTSNLDGFEEKIMKIEDSWMEDDEEADGPLAYKPATILHPSEQELATTRTLIAAWLHSGQAHRVITVLMNAPSCLLVPFFHKHSFLRTPRNAVGFVRQLRSLDGVLIIVDTLLVLSSSSMDVNENGCAIIPKPDFKSRVDMSLPVSPQERRLTPTEAAQPSKMGRFSRLMGVLDIPETDEESSKASCVPVPQAFGAATPRYLDFRKNENFAASLRSERDRRTQSWLHATCSQDVTKGIPVICRSKGASEESIAFQRELHQVSRIFYAGTNMISLRSGGRRKNSGETVEGSKTEILPLSLLTIEMASQKRRIEVPDEDSSFLLRAQPRPLVAVGVHRDPRNHDQSYKCFAATYDEPILRTSLSKYGGGRYIRRCLLKYYPNDRTASIELPNDGRQLDQRQDRLPESINLGSSASTLTNDFLKERHLCQKWAPKGSVPRSGSILASSVMETSDFTAVPRSGKAIDFVYRVSLFERPMVDLDGKKFMAYDSSVTGTHRADASSLEISDAALSLALLQIGRDWDYEINSEKPSENGKDIIPTDRPRLIRRSSVEVGKDGYPVIFLKYNRKQGDNSIAEVKPYRASYIRAAILITEARQEAQQQCLTQCVLSGSARSATKTRTEALLWPTVTLLDYSSSPEREKQSILLRDLKLGINHIDREQLRRNGLLSPRYPTTIQSLTAQIEGATSVREPGHAIPAMAPTVVMFRIRCVAIVELSDVEIEEGDTGPYKSPKSDVRLFREEWTVWRQFRDFSSLHKQLKSQVAQAEQSVSAGARLVGAATAAFSVGGTVGGPRRRQALIPSLGQATKATGLGLTKKAIQKRCGITDAYLKYLLSPNHLLNRCSELLLFLGAAYPIPSDVVTDSAPVNPPSDPFGRVDIIRTIHIAERMVSTRLLRESEDTGEKSVHFRDDTSLSSTQIVQESVTGTVSVPSTTTKSSGIRMSLKKADNLSMHNVVTDNEDSEEHPVKISKIKEVEMIPAIKAKIDEVPLSQVRHAIFDLIRYQFDFDNASFFRNRMFVALKTMSFAVTTSGEFRKMLYENHIKHVNAVALAGWIRFTLDMLWPDGVFFSSSPPLSPDEEIELAVKSKSALPDAFPDQIKSVIGQNITQNGLDMMHEMLQNRMVTKSMAYMLFDLLLLEIFPELQDILTCGSALDEE